MLKAIPTLLTTMPPLRYHGNCSFLLTVLVLVAAELVTAEDMMAAVEEWKGTGTGLVWRHGVRDKVLYHKVNGEQLNAREMIANKESFLLEYNNNPRIEAKHKIFCE